MRHPSNWDSKWKKNTIVMMTSEKLENWGQNMTKMKTLNFSNSSRWPTSTSQHPGSGGDGRGGDGDGPVAAAAELDNSRRSFK